MRTHRFHAVEDEVEQHLLELDAVATDRGEIGREVHVDLQIPEDGVRVDERSDFPDNLVDVERKEARLLFP